MAAEMRSAWLMAGLKIGIGLFVVGAIIGIRLVSVTPMAESDEPERSGFAGDLRPSDSTNEAVPASPETAFPAAENPIAANAASEPRANSPGAAEPAARSGDQLVSCRLKGNVHFTTADDCGMRGGRSTVFQSDR